LLALLRIGNNSKKSKQKLMKKQLILGSFLAIFSLANAQTWNTSGINLYSWPPNGKVGIGNIPTTRHLEVFADGLDDGIEVKTPTGSGNHDAMLLLNNRAPGGHSYWISSVGTGHLPNIPGALTIWDGTANASRLCIAADGNVGFGTMTPNDSKIHAVTSYNNVQAINVPRSAGLFETTTNVWGTYIGSKGTVVQTNPSTNLSLCYGMVGESSSGYGVWNRNFGVSGTASGGGFNEGGYFEANGPSNSTNMGIYCIANNGSTAWNDWAAYLDGKVMITGDLYHNLTLIFSDKRFKKDIQPLENISSKLEKMHGYTYNYRTDEFKEKRFDDKKHIGLIAQEVKEVFPELIREDDKGYYAVNYEGMIPVLLEAIKEQNKINEAQQKQLTEQKELINSLAGKSTGATSINQTESDLQGFAMDQNVPNPFSNETVIKYTITGQTKTATLNVYDLSGKQLTTFPLEKGSSSITITSEKLAAGIYIYSIVADGKIMDSKRMVVAEK
jgi:hypothetical protein